MEVPSLEIFGKYIFGDCAEQWLKLCKEQKKEWILKYTNKTDLVAINEFINNPKISKDCKCLDCGKTKKDVTNGILQEITTTTKPIEVAGNSIGNSNKRPKKVKGNKS